MRWEEGRLEGGSCSLVGMPYWEAGHQAEGHSSPLVVPVEEEQSSFDGSCGIAVLDTPSLLSSRRIGVGCGDSDL